MELINNEKILFWWESKNITERIYLREKYGFKSNVILDVDDYRKIYIAEEINNN